MGCYFLCRCVPSSTVTVGTQFIAAVRAQSVLGCFFALPGFPIDKLCSLSLPRALCYTAYLHPIERLVDASLRIYYLARVTVLPWTTMQSHPCSVPILPRHTCPMKRFRSCVFALPPLHLPLIAFVISHCSQPAPTGQIRRATQLEKKRKVLHAVSSGGFEAPNASQSRKSLCEQLMGLSYVLHQDL
jgi:hypothetical protein